MLSSLSMDNFPHCRTLVLCLNLHLHPYAITSFVQFYKPTHNHRRHCVVSLGKTDLSLLSTDSTQKDPSRRNWKIVDWDQRIKTNKQRTQVVLWTFICIHTRLQVKFYTSTRNHRRHCVVSLSKTHISLLSTGSTKKDPSRHNSKLLTGTLRIKQNKSTTQFKDDHH